MMDTGVRVQTRVIPKNPPGILGKTHQKTSKKPAPNLIQFQFVMPVIIKYFFMFKGEVERIFFFLAL